MRILLRHYGGMHAGEKKEYVLLHSVPAVGDEIHWPNRILRVTKVIWFANVEVGHAQVCLNVIEVT